MQALVLALLLAAILALFAPVARGGLKELFSRCPRLIWFLPPLLAAVFLAAEGIAGTFSWELTGLMLVYLSAPVAAVVPARRSMTGPQPGKATPRPAARVFIAVLLLWLPLEFAAGASLVPRPAQGFLHSVAYGIAILLALVLFTGYYPLAGMKYVIPRSFKDLWLPLAAFALLAPVLAVLGVVIGFIPPPHVATKPAGSMAAGMALIFAGTALPEEILFRSLIQNLLMRRFGTNTRSLFASSLIFGCAHLDNGPQPLPNWRYMILATIAGLAYGYVFQRSSSVCSSAALHTLVDWTKHFFF